MKLCFILKNLRAPSKASHDEKPLLSTSRQQNGTTITTLKKLQIGDRARLTGYTKTSRGYRHKLLTMGLTPGTELDLIRVAPMGDPVEIRVRGASLSLRKEEAAALHVEKL